MPGKTSSKPKNTSGKPVVKVTAKAAKGSAKVSRVKLAKEEVVALKKVPQKRNDLDIDHFLELL